MMKASCTLIASLLAASTLALSSSSSSYYQDGSRIIHNSKVMSAEKEKFAPRFDGLRFIETLVTAHR